MLFTDISKSAPTRSILLMNASRGTLYAGRLPPDSFGLRLHAGDTVKNCDRTVEHAKRTFHFRREIDVTRRVDDVNALLDPFESFVNAFFFALRPAHVVAADVIVIPRSRSCSIQSVTVVPSCTSPILWIMPV